MDPEDYDDDMDIEDFDDDDEEGDVDFSDDPDLEYVDLDDNDLEEGDAYDDDAQIIVEEGELETGAPKGRRQGGKRKKYRAKKLKKKKSIGRILRKAKEGKVKAGRTGKRQLAKFKRIRQMTHNDEMYYVAAQGGSILSSSIGLGKMLRAVEVDAIKSQAFRGLNIEPSVYTVPAGTTSDYAWDIQNNATLTGIRWFAYLLTVEASRFNMVPDGDFTVATYVSGAASGTASMTQTFRMFAQRRAMRIMFINAGMTGGRPRIVSTASVPYNAVAADPPLDGITINGLPTNYTAKVRLCVPGEAEVEKFFQLL